MLCLFAAVADSRFVALLPLLLLRMPAQSMLR